MHDVQYASVGDAIADLGQRRSYAPGELLFVEGDHSHCVYVCVEGRVRLFLTMPSGRELLQPSSERIFRWRLTVDCGRRNTSQNSETVSSCCSSNGVEREKRGSPTEAY